MSTCLQSVTRQSRKDRWCYYCAQTIPAGEPHNYYAGVTDGDFHSSRAHLECVKATEKWTYDDYDFFEPGSMTRPTKEGT